MGSVNKGSFKLNKVSGCSKTNNSAYNQSASSKFGNSNSGFKNGFRPLTKTNKIKEIIQKETKKKEEE